VVDSRSASKLNRQCIRRRRACTSCDYRFTTFELSEGDIDTVSQMAQKAERAAIHIDRAARAIAEITG